MDFGSMLMHYHVLEAFGMTIVLTLTGGLGALVLGTVIAVMRVSPVWVLQAAGALYVNVVRNTPLTLIVFFFAFGMYMKLNLAPLPTDNVDWQMTFWGVVALAVYHASFVAEALRSGVNTVPVGQAEAARAIGLTFEQSLTEIVLPQAARGAVAPLGNTLIALTKNTTVLATIGVAEASFAMRGMMETFPNMLYGIFAVIAGGFVVLTLPVGILFSHLSKRLAVAR